MYLFMRMTPTICPKISYENRLNCMCIPLVSSNSKLVYNLVYLYAHQFILSLNSISFTFSFFHLFLGWRKGHSHVTFNEQNEQTQSAYKKREMNVTFPPDTGSFSIMARTWVFCEFRETSG